jgi:hypothetical protein
MAFFDEERFIAPKARNAQKLRFAQNDILANFFRSLLVLHSSSASSLDNATATSAGSRRLNRARVWRLLPT